MTRSDRIEQLNQMMTTESGLDVLDDLYLQQFPDRIGSTLSISYDEMIEEILDVEYPCVSTQYSPFHATAQVA